ncbi:MAG: DAHL domain-containing protein, partial [Candidatus Thiodiazotropha endolucinida]
MSMLKQMYSKRSLLLVSLCIALILLLVVYWDDKSENYAELSHNLLQLKEMDARLDRDVLKITSFLLNQYDPLVRTTNRLRDLRQRIVAKVTEVDDRVLSSLTDRYWQGMDEKLAILEKIKFQAAVVRNGIHYLPIVARELKSVDPLVYQDVLELLNSLLAYDLFYTDSQLDDIVSTLKQLKSYEIVSPENKQKFEQVLFHIDSNIVDLTNLGALKTRYLAVPSQEYFEHVHSRYEQNRVDETTKKRRLIMALSVFVIVLLLSLWQLIRRLQNA